MLSGIGPANHLEAHNIAVIRDMPGVGSHLQDHMTVPVRCFVPLEDSLVKLILSTWHLLMYLLQYVLFGIGPFLSPEVAIFIQSRLLDASFTSMTATTWDVDAGHPENIPDIEVIPVAWGDPAFCKAENAGGFIFMASTLRPTSTETVRLASTDPFQEPIVDPNYLYRA